MEVLAVVYVETCFDDALKVTLTVKQCETTTYRW